MESPSSSASTAFSSPIPAGSPYPEAETAMQFWGFYLSEFCYVLEGMDMAAIPCNDRLGFGGDWSSIQTITLMLHCLGLLSRVAMVAMPVLARLECADLEEPTKTGYPRPHPFEYTPQAFVMEILGGWLFHPPSNR